MRVRREVDGAEGHVSEQTRLGAFVQAEEAEVLHDGPRADFLRACDLARHLQTNLYYF